MSAQRQRIVIGFESETKKFVILGRSSADMETEAINETLITQNKNPREWDAIAPDFGPRSSNRAIEIALCHFFQGLGIPKWHWNKNLEELLEKIKEAGEERQIL